MKIDKLIATIEKFESILEKEEFDFIKSIEEGLIQYKSSIENSFLSNPGFSLHGNTYTNAITNILNESLKSFSSLNVGRSSKLAEDLIDDQKETLPMDLIALMKKYLSELHSVIKEVDNFKYKNDLLSIPKIHALGFEIHNSKTSISSYRKSLLNFKNLLSHDYESKDDERIFEISFYSDNILLQAHALMSSMLDIIYNELCNILNIMSNEYPLKIIILHSGSDDFKLLGNSTVFSFLELVLSNSGQYFFANYTKDGEFKKLSVQFNDIANKLRIMKELELLGIDVSESNKSLQKSLLYIARVLDDNLRFQYKMEINGSEYKIIPDDKRSQIAYEPKLIEYKPLDITV